MEVIEIPVPSGPGRLAEGIQPGQDHVFKVGHDGHIFGPQAAFHALDHGQFCGRIVVPGVQLVGFFQVQVAVAALVGTWLRSIVGILVIIEVAVLSGTENDEITVLDDPLDARRTETRHHDCGRGKPALGNLVPSDDLAAA